MPRPILVTGASGFAGSHLVDQLLASRQPVAAWAHAGGRAAPARRDTRVAWDAVDILDARGVASALAALQPSVIYHCAGIADVGRSWDRPTVALRVNALGTHHVLDGVRRARLDCAVLVTGSALIYRPSAAAIDEDCPVEPSNPYGVSKLAQEMRAARASGHPVLIARPFNHAGPRQSPSYVTSSFAKQIAEIEAGIRDPVLRVGNLDSRRDITDVRDTVRAYRLMVERGHPGRPYNICSGRAYRIADLLRMLIEMGGSKIRVEQDPARLRPHDNPAVIGSFARLEADTGWRPEIPIERTLADLLAYWRGVLAETAPARP